MAYTKLREARLIQNLAIAGLDPAILSLDQPVTGWMRNRGKTPGGFLIWGIPKWLGF